MSTKGAETREKILARAIEVAGVGGLGTMTIGDLAESLSLSKSGLFAHFQSKERLQLAVLEAAAESFAVHVIHPALQRPRGEPRVIGLFENWLAWVRSERRPGGCIFVGASTEFDDQPGKLQELVQKVQLNWFEVTVRAAAGAIESGHFSEQCDPHQFAFELQALYLGFHHAQRLLKRPDAAERTQRAFKKLLQSARAKAKPRRAQKHRLDS